MRSFHRSVALALILILSFPLSACAADPGTAEDNFELPPLFTAPALTATAAPTVSFTDVPDDAWYAQAVSVLLEKGMMNGVGDNRFAPEETFTRASLATVLYRMAGEPAVIGEDSFTDTVPGQWYSNAVAWAEQTDVVQGYGNGFFGPDDPVTGEQLALMLWRQAGEPATETGETYGAHDYAQAAVRWADQRGLVSDGPTFLAAANASRARVTVMISRYLAGETNATPKEDSPMLLYMGQASIRIVTPENKVIYIDPYAGDGYDLPTDLILVTHGHFDHCALDKVKNRSEDCRIITHREAVINGEHQTFDLGYVTAEAVEAGYNRWHDVRECAGYVLTFSNGKKVYVTGDTSATKQMERMAPMEIDYAFYCCDGVYNMGMEEAARCAKLMGAKHNIPYHNSTSNTGEMFDR